MVESMKEYKINGSKKVYVNILGYVLVYRTAITKDKKNMGFATFLDKKEIFEVVFFPDAYEKYFHLLKYFKFFIVSGIIESKNNQISFEIKKLEPVFTNIFTILKNL
jgi:DNA polymerase III alpha subunit